MIYVIGMADSGLAERVIMVGRFIMPPLKLIGIILRLICHNAINFGAMTES